MEMKSNYLSNSHENYIRMLILFIPYLDYSFFFDDIYGSGNRFDRRQNLYKPGTRRIR